MNEGVQRGDEVEFERSESAGNGEMMIFILARKTMTISKKHQKIRLHSQSIVFFKNSWKSSQNKNSRTIFVIILILFHRIIIFTVGGASTGAAHTHQIIGGHRATVSSVSTDVSGTERKN